MSFIMIPLLKSPSKQIFLCDCEEMFWGSENCLFSLQRKQRQTGLQKWKSLSNLLNFTSQFPKQGLPIYLTSLPELCLEKGAQIGCKGPKFPNKSSSTGNKTWFCHIINEKCPVLMTFLHLAKKDHFSFHPLGASNAISNFSMALHSWEELSK